MEANTGLTDRDDINISTEEFDALEEIHDFSAAYKRNKKRMLKKYRKKICRPAWSGWVKAAAVFLLALSMPAIVSAASGSELFYRIWGTLGKQTVESHDEILYDEEKGTSCIVTYPKREYTNDGLEKVEELIGDTIFCQPLVKEIGDTKLTVLTAVYDGSCAVVEFTLERTGGVLGIHFDQLSNESKGAWFAEDAPFRLSFADCSESILVDLDRSTQEMLYCCAYMAASLPDQEAAGLTLEIHQDSGTETLFIPIGEKTTQTEYVNAGGGTIHLSPVSMDVDCKTGLGLTKDQIYDPWYIYYAAIHYQDGTIYVVHEKGMGGIHPCETEIDNTGYTCGTADGRLVFVFNRLVDIGNVESVIVNETVYTLK